MIELARDKMKRLKLIAILFVVMPAGLVVAMPCLLKHNDEPSWHGKTLTQWIDALVVDGTLSTESEATGAIRGIGTNGFPTLFKMITARDGAVKAKVIGLINSQNLIHAHIKTAQDKVGAAWNALFCLGTNALPAVPQLLKLDKIQNDQMINHVLGDSPAANCLYAIQQGVPTDLLMLTTFSECLNNSDVDIRRGAGELIKRWYSKDAERLGVYEKFPDLKPPVVEGGQTKAQIGSQ